jgi:O-antigen/teichoic acid export membrane protein
MLISLFKSYVFANHLSPETFGTYRYLMTFIEVATAFTLTGIPLVVSRSVAQGFGGTYVRGVVAYLKHSYIALTLTTAAALYYAYFENYTFALVLALAGVLSIGVNAARLYNAVLEGKKRSDLNARYQIISNTIPALLVIACVLLDYSLVAIILVFFSSQLVLHGFFALRVRKIFNLGNEDDPTAKKFSFHLSVMGALSLATEHIDKLFLFQWLGPAQLALYTFSTALPEQFNVLGKSLRTLVYPKISERPFAVTKKHIFKKTLYLFFVCTVLFISYISIAPFLSSIHRSCPVLTGICTLDILSLSCPLQISTLRLFEDQDSLPYKNCLNPFKTHSPCRTTATTWRLGCDYLVPLRSRP